MDYYSWAWSMGIGGHGLVKIGGLKGKIFFKENNITISKKNSGVQIV